MSTVSFPQDAKVFIQWDHIDGPMISFPGAAPKWLSLYEIILFKLGYLKLSDFDVFGRKKKFNFKVWVRKKFFHIPEQEELVIQNQELLKTNVELHKELKKFVDDEKYEAMISKRRKEVMDEIEHHVNLFAYNGCLEDYSYIYKLKDKINKLLTEEFRKRREELNNQ